LKDEIPEQLEEGLYLYVENFFFLLSPSIPNLALPPSLSSKGRVCDLVLCADVACIGGGELAVETFGLAALVSRLQARRLRLPSQARLAQLTGSTALEQGGASNWMGRETRDGQ